MVVPSTYPSGLMAYEQNISRYNFIQKMNCPRVGESLEWTKVPSCKVNEAQEDTKLCDGSLSRPCPWLLTHGFTFLFLSNFSFTLCLQFFQLQYSHFSWAFRFFLIKHESNVEKGENHIWIWYKSPAGFVKMCSFLLGDFTKKKFL